MKKILLFLIALLNIGTVYSQTWIAQSSGVTNNLYGVSFSDVNNRTAVGEGGTILRTTNSETFTYLLSPNGGEKFIAGTTDTIKWTGSSVDFVKLEYTTDDGAIWNFIDTDVPASSGSYLWTVPYTPTTQAKVRVTNLTDNSFVTSAAPFTIIDPRHFIPIWSGNPYQAMNIFIKDAALNSLPLEFGDEIGIFDDTVCVGSVTIQVTSNPLEIKVASDDPLTPKIDGFVTGDSPTYKLWKNSNSSEISRVTAAYNPVSPVPVFSPLGTAFVSLDFQNILLLSPNGEETFIAGKKDTIKWISEGLTEINLEYTTDNGTNWISILATTPASTGSYVWTIPNTPSTNCKVRISDVANSSFADVSDNVFSIIQPNVKVLKPNGGENFVVGKIDTIKWSSSNIADVKLEFTTNNGTNWNSILASTPASAGSFVWTIPNTPSTNCKVRISDVANSSFADVSDNVFSIIQPIVKVLKPNGGENFIVGKTDTIKWSSSNIANVKLEYTTNNGTNWIPILATTPASTGSYVWTIPNTPSTNCKVRITDVANSSFTDTSDNVFSIIKPAVTVLKPNGGENFVVGKTDTIKWSSSNIADVKLEYTTNNGANWIQILATTPASAGSFVWTTPNTPSTNCKVRITDVANSSFADISDNVFSIIKPGVTILKPNGGENFVVGKTDTIKWSSTNIANVKLEYTTDNGSNWISILTSTPASTGSYIWTIPNTPSINCKVRISDVANSLFADESDNVFSIIKPGVTVLKPNGGENFIVGKVDTIKWSSLNIADVKLEYTTNNGANWIPILATTPASAGSYVWTIPNTPSTNCKVRISDVANSLFADESDNVFSIIKPGVTVLKPNGGENFIVGKVDTIKWSSSNIADVKLEYTTNNGANWIPILATTPASTGSYIWTIPNSPSTNCKVRITDVTNLETNAISSTFSIIKPAITLLSPNGGEKWLIQSDKQITWTNTDVDSIKIEYSSNNGSSWDIIAQKVFAADATYTWNVNSIPTPQALIRVSQVNDASVQDLSDNAFTIYKEALAVTSPNGSERFRAKSTAQITWNISEIVNPKARSINSVAERTVANAPIQNVKIEYTSDNGTSWNSVISTISAGVKSYNWDVPVIESKVCKIRIVDVDDATHADTSDGVFEIYTPKLTVTSPNGGEIWRTNTTKQITWISSEINKVRIEYSTNDGFSWKIISDSLAASPGSIDWIIPAERTSKAKVKVTDIAYASTSDSSDNTFTLLFPEISLTAPVGGENWKTNTVQQIKWSSSDIELLLIEYSTDNGTSWLLINNSVLASSGIYNWTIPMTPTDQAKIRVSDVNYKEINAVSGVFTIIKPLVLLTPQGGEKWFSGSVQQIKWNYISVDSVKLEFSLNNGTSWETIANSLPAPLLIYDWHIPQNINSTQCRVKITDRNNILTADSSVDVFTIINPTLTMLTPNGGENLKGGAVYQITWKNQNSDSLAIDYSLNNGTTWTNITKACNAKIEKFTWVIPKVTSTQCLILITDKNFLIVSDTSDRVFSIYTPQITLLSPRGGENWYVGETKQIKWQSSFVEKIKIELTTDNGISWNALTSAVNAADSSYSWFINKIPSPACKVKITAVEDSTVKDSSKSNFSIVILPPSIQVSVYQNPVLTQYCNVVLVTDSLLSELPVTKVWRDRDTSSFEMTPIPNSANVYECSIKFDTTGIYNIASYIISRMGIERDTIRQFSVGMILPNLFASIKSKDKGLTLTINPGVIEEKTFISIEEEKVNKEIIYHLQPEKTFKKAIGLELSFAGASLEEINKLSIFIFEDGEWKAIPSEVNKKEKTVSASLTTFRKVKLGIDINKKEKIDLPQVFALIQNYPNPFNPSTVITFHLPEDCDVSLEIYNLLGAKISTLRSGFTSAGRYSVTWDGLNDANIQVPSGIYLYRLKTNKFDQVRKMIFLK